MVSTLNNCMKVVFGPHYIYIFHQRTKVLQYDWSMKLQYIAYLKAYYDEIVP